MNAANTGLLAGLVLGATAMIGGFGALVVALLVGIVGLVLGRILDGELDLNALLGRGRDR